MMEAEMHKEKSPREWRSAFRSGFVTPTTGLARGYAQANLVIMHKEYALDFASFCLRNPKPCPLLEIGSPGDPYTKFLAASADIRADIPLYWVYRHGVLVERVGDITSLWTEDLVYFLIGCSFGFEEALLSHGVPVRHIENGSNCPMYISNIDCIPAGPFSGKMVVSMRGIPASLVSKAVTITARYPLSHGAPVWVGDPEGLGIKDLDHPDFGDPPVLKPGDVPVFWACGVTAQMVASNAKLPLVIGHAPGHMFIADVLNEELSITGGS